MELIKIGICNMNVKLLIIMISLILSGCQSEVDKCLNDYMKAFDSKPWAASLSEQERKSIRLDAIATFRNECMKASK